MSANIEQTGADANIEQTLIEKVRVLPLEQKQEVLAFVEGLVEKISRRRTIWDEIREITKEVPAEVWERLPTDGAEQHDHYLYGTPKK